MGQSPIFYVFSDKTEGGLTPRRTARMIRGRGHLMEHIFLTYDEAANWLGIKPDSVRRRARARKWPRRTGNDGKAQVGIPPDVIGADNPPGPPPGPPPDTEAAELRVENRMLRERLDELRDERDKWRDQAERLSESGKPVTGILARIFGRK